MKDARSFSSRTPNMPDSLQQSLIGLINILVSLCSDVNMPDSLIGLNNILVLLCSDVIMLRQPAVSVKALVCFRLSRSSVSLVRYCYYNISQRLERF